MRFTTFLNYVFILFFAQSIGQTALVAAPMVQKVCNSTDFGFYILYHGDSSDCSLHNKSMIIQPRTIFLHEFLLEIGQKGLILRPVFYKDPQTGTIYWLVDQQTYEYNDDLIQKAYEAWLKRNNSRKNNKSNAGENPSKVWFDQWLGQDVALTFDKLELLGYILDLSRIRIQNSCHQHVQWLSFAKGIFSKLVMNLHLEVVGRKKLTGRIVVTHGPGGICTNGSVERL